MHSMKRAVKWLTCLTISGCILFADNIPSTHVHAVIPDSWNAVFSDVSIPTTSAGYFPDAAGNWASSALRTLIASGLMKGYNGFIRPDDSITRAEAADLVILISGSPLQSDNRSSFPDVQASDWDAKVIATAVNMGIITGEPDGMFHPNAAVTRGEFATIVAKTFPLANTMTDSLPFPDVSLDDWDSPAIGALADAGFISGRSDGEFHPTDPITRAEASAILVRILASHTTDWGDGQMTPQAAASQVENYFREAVALNNAGTFTASSVASMAGGLELEQDERAAAAGLFNQPSSHYDIQSVSTSILFHSLGFDAVQLNASVLQTTGENSAISPSTVQLSCTFFVIKTGFSDEPTAERSAIFAATPWHVNNRS